MNKLLRIFVTGLLAALPLAATILIFIWGAQLLYGWVGPGTPIGQVVVSLGFGVAGSEALGYLIGIVIVMAAIFCLGLLVEAGVQVGARRAIEAILRRIPLVGSVYDMIQKFVDMVARKEGDGARSMSPVWCHFGGAGGAAVLALLSTPQPVVLGDRRYLGVLIPTAPVPVGGALVYVPEEWITPAEVGVEGLTSIYVSMGVTSAQHLGTRQVGP